MSHYVYLCFNFPILTNIWYISAFIARTTKCFGELNSSLLCEMLPIMQLTPVIIVCKMKECRMFVTLTASFHNTIAEL